MRVKSININKKLYSVIIMLGIVATLIPIICTIEDKNVTVSATECSVKATIHNKIDYSDTGVDLTESGISISGWQPDASKYIKIQVNTQGDDSNKHIVDVELPKELYFANTDINFDNTDDNDEMENINKVTFKRNDNITNVNGISENEYNVHDNSGILSFELSSQVESAIIELEVRYDEVLWNKRSNSAITKAGVKPINIVMYHSEGGERTELNSLCVKSATTGASAASYQRYYKWKEEDYASNFSKTLMFQFQITGVNKGLYLDTATITFDLPYWTDSSGNKYYLEYVKDSFKYESPQYDTTKGIVDDSQEGIVEVTIDNFDYIFGWDYFYYDLKLPDTLPEEAKTANVISFSNGYMTLAGNSNNGTQNITYCTMSILAKEYAVNLVENLRLYSAGTVNTYKDVDKSSVILLGGVGVYNDGAVDSGAYTFSAQFPTETLVTTCNIISDNITEYIDVEYTLCNEQGELVYFDSDGNEVSAGTSGAISTFVHSLENWEYECTCTDNLYTTLSREDLTIESHRNYYFKTIKYVIQEVKAGVKNYYEGRMKFSSSAGNFFGYINPSAELGKKTNIYCRLQKVGASAYRYVYTYQMITDKKIVSGGITPRSSENKTITAGEEIEIENYIWVEPRQEGSIDKLENIRIGVVLPEGVTIDPSRVELQTYRIDYTNDYVENVYVKSSKNGYNCWVIEVKPEIILGYFDENLYVIGEGRWMDFKFVLSTDVNMRATNIYTDEMVFATGKDYTNNIAGKNYQTTADPWDLNENGDVSDSIIKMYVGARSTISILANTVQVAVTDSISVDGSSTVEGNKVTINNMYDVLTYTVNVKRKLDGILQEYEQIIPITRKSSKTDVFGVQNNDTERFDFMLTEAVYFEGTDIFEVLYCIEENLSYNELKSLEATKWYTIDELLASHHISEVTSVKIVLKDNKPVNTDFDTNINLKMRSTNYKNEIITGNVNIWKSRAYYKFTYASGTISSYYVTKGCVAEIGFESKTINPGDIYDAPRKETDEICEFDDTPDTGESNY